MISTYGVLYGSREAIINAMVPLQAYVLGLVTTLYIPCIATIGAIKAEAGWKWAMFTVVYMIGLASVVGIITYHAALALGF